MQQTFLNPLPLYKPEKNGDESDYQQEVDKISGSITDKPDGPAYDQYHRDKI
jgi:hypothetical protein